MKVKEIYVRDERDPYYNPYILDYRNEVEEIVSQIRVLLGTTPGQVFGDSFFGVDLERMIFGTKKDAQTILKDVNEQIQHYINHPDSIKITTDLNFGDSGKGYDYGVLDIYLNGVKCVGFLFDQN